MRLQVEFIDRYTITVNCLHVLLSAADAFEIVGFAYHLTIF